jgi:hypothetical protein
MSAQCRSISKGRFINDSEQIVGHSEDILGPACTRLTASQVGYRSAGYFSDARVNAKSRRAQFQAKMVCD